MRRIFLLLAPLLGLAVVLCPGGLQSDVDAGTAIRLQIPELVQHAQLVIEGRVRSVTVELGSSGLIESNFLIDVDRTFQGPPENTRSVRLPGGVLPNGDGLLLPGMPTIVAGEDVILFLSGASASGARMPIGLSQGKFRVESSFSGQKRVSRRHGSLTTVDPASGTLIESDGAEIFDYAAVVAEIYAGVEMKEALGNTEQEQQQ